MRGVSTRRRSSHSSAASWRCRGERRPHSWGKRFGFICRSRGVLPRTDVPLLSTTPPRHAEGQDQGSAEPYSTVAVAGPAYSCSEGWGRVVGVGRRVDDAFLALGFGLALIELGGGGRSVGQRRDALEILSKQEGDQIN